MTLSQGLPEDLGGEGRGKPRSHVISSSPPPPPALASALRAVNLGCRERISAESESRGQPAAGKTGCWLLPSPSFPPPEKAEEDGPPVAPSPLLTAAISPVHPSPPRRPLRPFQTPPPRKRHQNPNLRKGSGACRSPLPPARCSSEIFSLSSPGFAPRGLQRGGCPPAGSLCCPSRPWHRPHARRFCFCAALPGVVQANSAIKATTRPVHQACSAGKKHQGKAKLVLGRVPTTKCPCSSPTWVEEPPPGLYEPWKTQKAAANPAWPRAQPSPFSCRTHSLTASILPWQRLLDFLRLHLGDSPGRRRVLGACNEPPELLHLLLGCSKSPAPLLWAPTYPVMTFLE